MAFLPTWAGVKVEMVYSFGGQPVVNLYWLTATDSIKVTSLELGTIAGLFDTWRRNSLRAFQNQNLSITRIRASDQTEANSLEYVYTPGIQTTGLLTGGALPGHTAANVTLLTNRSGRRYRGRSYLGGLDRSLQQDANHMTAGMANTITNAYIALINALISAGRFRYGVRSGVVRTLGISPPASYATVEPITTVAVDTAYDHQDRRLSN